MIANYDLKFVDITHSASLSDFAESITINLIFYRIESISKTHLSFSYCISVTREWRNKLKFIIISTDENSFHDHLGPFSFDSDC